MSTNSTLTRPKTLSMASIWSQRSCIFCSKIPQQKHSLIALKFLCVALSVLTTTTTISTRFETPIWKPTSAIRSFGWTSRASSPNGCGVRRPNRVYSRNFASWKQTRRAIWRFPAFIASALDFFGRTRARQKHASSEQLQTLSWRRIGTTTTTKNQKQYFWLQIRRRKPLQTTQHWTRVRHARRNFLCRKASLDRSTVSLNWIRSRNKFKLFYS